MHIPDGYLSPQTYAPLWGVMIPIWAWASAVLKKTLGSRRVPILAMASAFSFVIMMFNVPVVGGTTGHATGAPLASVLLGPWGATLAISIALIIQALLFGDGGITAIGANCFNMAFAIPIVSYIVYKAISGRSDKRSKLRWIGAGVGGYIGLNVAALLAAIEFGIQPSIAHTADGKPLYCPYGLSVAIPAMMIWHLAVFGIIEAVVTALVVAYIQRIDPDLLA